MSEQGPSKHFIETERMLGRYGFNLPDVFASRELADTAGVLFWQSAGVPPTEEQQAELDAANQELRRRDAETLLPGFFKEEDGQIEL